MRLYCLSAALATLMAVSALAANDDLKFVGTWDGISSTPIYTKLIFHPDTTTTYCYVQNCRQQECWQMAFEGSTEGVFWHSSTAGDWEFTRISVDEIRGTFTNAAGEISRVTLEPE